MNRTLPSLFFVLLFVFSITAREESQTTIIIEPDIGNNTISITQIYCLTQEGLTSFQILTISLSYADLEIFDDTGNLDYEIGDNIIIGRNIYRKITVFFREPVKSPYTFTVKYYYFTSATGKPVTGKYLYTITPITDSTVVIYDVPLTDITETSRSSPKAVIEEDADSTRFIYEFSKKTTIILNYELKEGIDYADIETRTFYQKGYTFEVTYPEKAEVFLEDIEFFIDSVFPVLLEEAGVPLRFTKISVELVKEEDTWAAAEYKGEGKIRILINNTASYPSQFLAHELIHSYIGDFPRYLEEGVADYFEDGVGRHFAKPRPENYIPNQESFFQTYERQFNEVVNITQSRYGLGLTDHQEALIYAKYSKGTNVMYEIAYACGHETMQEMLRTLKVERDCSLNQLVYNLSEGDEVYRILKKYQFDVVPPYAYPAEELLQEVREQSWWGATLCFVLRFKEKIRAATPENIEAVKQDIQSIGEIASKTDLLADGVVLMLLFFLGAFSFRGINRKRKENPRILYYFYCVPVLVALVLFSYFLYEFLFNGYKFGWILRNILVPWGFGIGCGVAVVLLLLQYLKGRERRIVVDGIWSASFFAVLVAAAYFYGFTGILVMLGYTLSLMVLFIMRRRGYFYRKNGL